MVLIELSRRAIFALSTGLPNIGFAMLDKSPGRPILHRLEDRADQVIE